MRWNKRFKYPASQRSLIQGSRHYDIGEMLLPSVTTILSATQSEEKRQSLAAWRKRVGEQGADRIRDMSAMRGSSMHKYLEAYIQGSGHMDLTAVGLEAHPMAQQIINQGLGPLEEVWGTEVTVHYPLLYAGATDLVGIYNSRESIIDFKQTNKPKKREWIEDYFIQLGAYAMAHNFIYDTKIQSGIILMCSKDRLFQKFEVTDKEFVNYQHAFLKKVDEYYRNCNQNKEAKRYKNEEISKEISH